MDDELKKISDMYLASALLAYGATLAKIDRTDEKRQRFCFKDNIKYVYVLEPDRQNVAALHDPLISDIETLFISKTLLFPPSYPDAIRSIKSAIYST